MHNTKKEIILFGLKILLMVLVCFLLPVWIFYYYFIGIIAVILTDFLENITGLYLMNEIFIILSIPLFTRLLFLIKNNQVIEEIDKLYRNFQIIILTLFFTYPLLVHFSSNENFYFKYFSMLLPVFLVLILGNRKEIKRLLN